MQKFHLSIYNKHKYSKLNLKLLNTFLLRLLKVLDRLMHNLANKTFEKQLKIIKKIPQNNIPYLFLLNSFRQNKESNLFYQHGSSLLHMSLYQITKSKLTKKGYQWDNSAQQLQNVLFKNFKISNITVLQNPSQQVNNSDLPIVSEEEKEIANKESITSLNAINIQNYYMSENSLFWEIKTNQIRECFQNNEMQNKIESKQNPSSFYSLSKKVVQIARSNHYLNKGNFQDYENYPLSKLTQIALNFVQNHNISNHNQLYGDQSYISHWSTLQIYFRLRMHNCSLKDYLKMLYICLKSYSFYQFQENFIQSLIIGVRKQIPLMQEVQAMQLFYILSNIHRKGFKQYQLKKKFSIDVPKQRQIKYSQSQFFQHQLLYQLQNKILQKIVDRYKNKYLNNVLNFKQPQFFKLCFWLQMIIAFKNSSTISQQNKQATKYLLNLVEVVLNKFKNETSTKNKGSLESRILQNKSLKFNSFKQLVEIFEILSICKQFIIHQAEYLEQSSNKHQEYVYVALKLQDLIKTFLSYQNVKLMIKQHVLGTLIEGQNKVQKQIELKKQKSNLLQQLLKWRLLSILVNYMPLSDLSEQYKVFQLFQMSYQLLEQNKNSLNSRTLLQICDLQIQTFYAYWNNKNLLSDIKTQQHQINFKEVYKKIISSCFQKQNKVTLIDYLTPQSACKIITFEISQYFQQFSFLQKDFYNKKIINFYQSDQQNEENQNDSINGSRYAQIFSEENLSLTLQNLFKAKDILIQYGSEMLGIQKRNFQNSNIQNDNEDLKVKKLYIREFQWPFYNYCKLLQHNIVKFLRVSKQSKIEYIQELQSYSKRLEELLQILQERNKLANRYIQQSTRKSHQFSPSSNALHFKTMLPSTNHNINHLILRQSTSSTFTKLDKSTLKLSERILQSLQKQKKQYLKDEDLIKVNKFFTEIKAFDVMEFGVGVTNFNISCQFLCNYAGINRSKGKQYQMENNHVLAFYKLNQIKRNDKQVQKIMFETNGYNYDSIDIDRFLKMHINQRVQFLKDILAKGLKRKLEKKTLGKNTNKPSIEGSVY